METLDQITSGDRHGSLRFPSVSIAICTRNRPPALAECLEHLVEAMAVGPCPFPRTEIIVVDNAPVDDRVAKVVTRFSDVRYVREPRPGLSVARNRAINEASGELLAFIDDDVRVAHNWLRGLQLAWARAPHAGVFVGPVLAYRLVTDAQVIFEQCGGFGSRFQSLELRDNWAERGPCAWSCGTGCNMVFRRDLLVKLGGFDESLGPGTEVGGGDDLDMFYRVVNGGYPLVNVPELLTFHDHRSDRKQLRQQMWTWGASIIILMAKVRQTDRANRSRARRFEIKWFIASGHRILLSFLNRDRDATHWPLDLNAAELRGAIYGLIHGYRRLPRHAGSVPQDSISDSTE